MAGFSTISANLTRNNINAGGLKVSDPFKKNFFSSPGSSQQLFHMNELIKENREIALRIMKPTKKQLKHGLELHKNSVVFDTYACQPTAAVNGSLYGLQ